MTLATSILILDCILGFSKQSAVTVSLVKQDDIVRQSVGRIERAMSRPTGSSCNVPPSVESFTAKKIPFALVEAVFCGYKETEHRSFSCKLYYVF